MVVNHAQYQVHLDLSVLLNEFNLFTSLNFIINLGYQFSMKL